jgi:hypothetical protein
LSSNGFEPALGEAKKNPKQRSFGFKSTPMKEGGGDKGLIGECVADQ